MKFYFKSLIFSIFCAACLMMTVGNVFAYDAGNILVRGRVISVNPNSGSDKIPGTNSEIKVENAVTLEVDFTYMINPNFGLELILGTTKHDLKVGSSDGGETSVLPPTLIAQYHFLPEGLIKPYVGAGLNYTIFYNSKDNSDDKIDIDNTFGLAAQAGVDIDINEKWFVNVDVKYISMKTKVEDEIDLTINPMVFGVGVGTFF